MGDEPGEFEETTELVLQMRRAIDIARANSAKKVGWPPEFDRAVANAMAGAALRARREGHRQGHLCQVVGELHRRSGAG